LSKLRLVNAVNGTIETDQVINPFGDVSNRLDYGLEWVFPILKEYGFEAKIEYILEDNGTQFEVGLCDFSQKGFTDWKTYVEFNLIDKTDVADFKKQYDTKFNLFSDKNYRNEPITPATAVNVLKKAIPISTSSKWNQTQNVTLLAGANSEFLLSANIQSYSINNTLTPFYQQSNLPYEATVNNYRVISARNNLSSITIKNTQDILWKYRTNGSLPTITPPRIRLKAVCFPNPYTEVGAVNNALWTKILYTKTIISADWQDFQLPTEINNTLDFIPRGYSLSVFWELSWATENLGSGEARMRWDVYSSEFEITSIETAIDIVVKGVRQIDALKQASKFIKDTPINAVDYQVGGKHYNNFVFNKRMVSGKTDFFYSTPKDLFENLIEVNQDFENLKNEIFVGHENDFYKNVEIGALLELPSKDYNESYNDRFMINNLKYDFETFEQDRDAEQTNKSIHTQSEWNFQNDGVENKKEVKVKFVRDGLAIQKMADLEIQNPTTSTTDDDKVYITQVVEIAPNSFATWSNRLYMAFDVVNFKLIIYNNTSEQEESNVVFTWDRLGLVVGGQFQILAGANAGTFTISQITPRFIRLTPLTPFIPLTGDYFIKVKYFYSGVQYATRTTEGFINTPIMLNTFYSIKRNLKYFYEQFATALMYSKKDILNLFFKNNGSFSSQLTTETEPVIENATILYSDLPTPILDAMEVNIDCVATMEQIKTIIENYKVNRGFIRVYNNDNVVKRVYFKKLEQEWSTNKLTLLAEKQYESGELELTINDGAIVVNGATYTLAVNWWRIENEYLQVFDENNLPISNKYKFNLVILNGLIYESIFDLNEALLTL
jgi:hypothetical protein